MIDPQPARPWLVAASVTGVASLLVVALRIWLSAVGPFPGDEWVVTHIWRSAIPSPLLDLGTFFAVLGTPTVAVMTAAASLPLVFRVAGRRGLIFIVVSGFGVIVNMALKALSGPTPMLRDHFEATAQVGERITLNFPSGHTVYGVVFFGALAWLFWRRRRIDVAAPLTIVVVLMGPFRVVTESHYVSDVIAGYLVGAAWLITAIVVCGVTSPRPGLLDAHSLPAPKPSD